MVKGSTEVIVLSLLQERDLYGYEMTKLIGQQSEGLLQFREGTLYPALKRLELQHFITSYRVASTDGPQRKYYQLTYEGRLAQKRMSEEWHAFARAMQRLVGGVQSCYGLML